MPLAAVPETAINKNRDSLLAKDEIRPAWQSLVPAPADDAGCTEDRGKF
jgi:hypothetical protein